MTNPNIGENHKQFRKRINKKLLDLEYNTAVKTGTRKVKVNGKWQRVPFPRPKVHKKYWSAY